MITIKHKKKYLFTSFKTTDFLNSGLRFGSIPKNIPYEARIKPKSVVEYVNKIWAIEKSFNTFRTDSLYMIVAITNKIPNNIGVR